MAETPLVLPAECPICKALLQRINPGSPFGEKRGVVPHYETCHPEVPAHQIPIVLVKT